MGARIKLVLFPAQFIFKYCSAYHALSVLVHNFLALPIAEAMGNEW